MVEPKFINIKELIGEKKEYIVPIYQRNYAWKEAEISLLLHDLEEAYKRNPDQPKDYYIGSLIVFSRGENKFEVIDGQQRLTTLVILLTFLNNIGLENINIQENINLKFDHRNDSNEALIAINSDNPCEHSISLGYKLISKHINLDSNNLWRNNKFISFILKYIKILRTEVLPDTDLNHYFEIMNNRGKQLEKHEVLKARLMNKLRGNNKHETKQKRALFATIWEACSDMNVYALKRFQYSSESTKSLRTILFGTFCEKLPTTFDDLLKGYLSIQIEKDGKKSYLLKDILSGKYGKESKSDSEHTERGSSFSSIIDFPNFLLHVLRIYLKDTTIQLNDKYLLKQFEMLNTNEHIEEFIVCLLRIRLLFDRYIIKSKNDDDWVLLGLKRYKNGKYFYFKEVNSFGTAFDDNTDNTSDNLTEQQDILVKLLSMFHVSFRQRIYKTWLSDILTYLNEKNCRKYSVSADKYIKYLEWEANKAYKMRSEGNILLNGGTQIQNYVFNYLDYLLWRNNKTAEYKIGAKIILKASEFSFSNSRTSVEHYFAQNRMNKDEHISEELLDQFGNLCLISHHQNSALSDKSTGEKRAKYESKDLACQSIKQAIMLEQKNWNDKNIKKHYNDMINILTKETKRILRRNKK